MAVNWCLIEDSAGSRYIHGLPHLDGAVKAAAEQMILQQDDFSLSLLPSLRVRLL